MMKEEFIHHLNSFGNNLTYEELPDEVYKTIEFVYNYHPAVHDKDDIARIYNLRGGFQIILDMVSTADYWMKRENEINTIRHQISELQKQIDKYNNDYREASSGVGF